MFWYEVAPRVNPATVAGAEPGHTIAAGDGKLNCADILIKFPGALSSLLAGGQTVASE
ncbi:MAG TPA: hypothetical protein VKR61_04105 [Bryobacteraceae bacterium]|nr:hypothetical protein [Bryobacteraceae bacterium]